MTVSDKPPGLAFDSNLLNKQTPRRLMSMWMESAGTKVLILPPVMKELCAPNLVDDSPAAQRRNALHSQCWNDVLAMRDVPYALLQLSDEEKDVASEVLQRFTLRCFPKLNEPSEILRENDAMILAQGIAAGVDCVVSNDVSTIDHYEINDLVAKTLRYNAGIVLDADRAMLQAHPGGHASRQLLLTAMASNWPRPEDSLSPTKAHAYVRELATKLAQNVNMPSVARRLVSAFEIDEDLDQLLDAAQELARTSQMLRCERLRAQMLRDDALLSPRGGERTS